MFNASSARETSGGRGQVLKSHPREETFISKVASNYHPDRTVGAGQALDYVC